MSSKAKARRRVLRGRALLVATAGAATVVYLGCSNNISGNLVAPPGDAAVDRKTGDATDDFGVSSGNLVAPPPPPPSDAGDAASDAPSDAPEGG
jgi:hypothetical protein